MLNINIIKDKSELYFQNNLNKYNINENVQEEKDMQVYGRRQRRNSP